MKEYIDLVEHVLSVGTRKENRTGVDTISTFNHNYEIDLAEGFPLLTTKQISWKNIVIENIWFLSGQTDISILKRHGCRFWDSWADENGKVPSAYGNFWRHFPVHSMQEKQNPSRTCVSCHTTEMSDCKCGKNDSYLAPTYNDQIRWVLDEMRRNPMSRRMVVSAWAPGNAQTSKLPPCHSLFMFNVQNQDPSIVCHYGHNYGADPICGNYDGRIILPHGEGMCPGRRWCPECNRDGRLKDPEILDPQRRLCLHLTQRSCDVALGVPYNVAGYSFLLQLFAQMSGLRPGIFAHTLVDAHIYTAKPNGSMAEYDHIPKLKEQITRTPKALPKLIIDPSIRDLQDIEGLMDPKLTTDEVMSHFVLEGYDPYPAVSFKVAV